MLLFVALSRDRGADFYQFRLHKMGKLCIAVEDRAGSKMHISGSVQVIRGKNGRICASNVRHACKYPEIALSKRIT